MKKIGFIDYFLHEWHADHFPEFIYEVSKGEMKVCYAWGEIDSPREGGFTNKEWADKLGIELCLSQEEVIEKSDYLIVLSPDNAERHVDLCKLALVSKKPTYVDKTFAASLNDAKIIVENAENTPFFSASALRYDLGLQAVKKDDIEAVDCRCAGDFKIYTIHMVEPIYLLMGKAKRVLALGNVQGPTLLFDYNDGKRAVLSFFDHDNVGFNIAIRYKDGSAALLPFDSDYFKAFTMELVSFFDTGVPSVCINDTIDIISMLDAGKKAVANTGVWVEVV